MMGSTGALRVGWVRQGQPDAVARAEFYIADTKSLERTGRVRLTIPNDTGATMASAPMTVGVPFPRGVLESTDNLRLVDENGTEVPLQVRETARWSRFGGGVKWALGDFTLDLAGSTHSLYLEYGPHVRRGTRPNITINSRTNAFPGVAAGRLRIDSAGVSFDFAGNGRFRPLLKSAALAGAFVEHLAGMHALHGRISRGTVFSMPPTTQYEVEELGGEKVVVRAEGWYENNASSKRFCRFVTRYVIHRDSPVFRIFHTWIFTGDGNRDRIRNMGWRFPLPQMQPAGFLSEFGDKAQWLAGDYLRQHDRDAFEVFHLQDVPPLRIRPLPAQRLEDWRMQPPRPLVTAGSGQRGPGVAAASGNGALLYLGVKDFWKNFPRSLAFEDGVMTFYEWPRYGRPSEHPISAEDMGDVWRLWFAHEGESLSFCLPRELTESSIYLAEGSGEPHFAYDMPESVNAQGVAKTAEMWLYLTSEEVSLDESTKVLQGLNDETLRPVVDPHWMAGSGAFYEIGAADQQTTYAKYAQTYRENARSPLRQVERMGIYGKWLYGDLLRAPDMDSQQGNLYRTLRKAHWGWPYSWLPYVTTGDPEFLRFAQAATRMMSDVGFCHYVSEDVRAQFADLPQRCMWIEKQPFREIGWHNRNLIPWAGYWGPTTRMYCDETDYLWHAWYMSNYHRARDVALAWAAQAKVEAPDTADEEKFGRGPITAAVHRDRCPVNLLKQFLETYQATYDPWFLAAAHAIGDMHLSRYRKEEYRGHWWEDGITVFQRYTGSPDYEEFFFHFARQQADWHAQGDGGTLSIQIPSTAYAYQLTGDSRYLDHAAGVLDVASWALYGGGDPWYYQGFYTPHDSNVNQFHMSYMQRWGPLVLGALNKAGGEPENPIPAGFSQTLSADTRIIVRKQSGTALVLRTYGKYQMWDPGGQLHLEGDESQVILDADAPPGAYVVSLGPRSVMLPISPPGTPEVIVVGPGESIGEGAVLAQHWFLVPRGVESFWIEFDNPEFFGHQVLRQHVVWDPDGGEAWAHRERRIDHDPEIKNLRGEILVAPGQDGRLWRVTLPGERGVSFRLDPRIPSVLAHSANRWFDPQN